jgi:hypothetical protein
MQPALTDAEIEELFNTNIADKQKDESKNKKKGKKSKK